MFTNPLVGQQLHCTLKVTCTARRSNRLAVRALFEVGEVVLRMINSSGR